jgi:hypothetical protein
MADHLTTAAIARLHEAVRHAHDHGDSGVSLDLPTADDLATALGLNDENTMLRQESARRVSRERLSEALTSALPCSCPKLLKDGSHAPGCLAREIEDVVDTVLEVLAGDAEPDAAPSPPGVSEAAAVYGGVQPPVNSATTTNVDVCDHGRLRRLADARREYTATSSPADRQFILGQCAALEAVADVLTGASSWPDLVASYAPSWRWNEFNDDQGDARPEPT